VVAKQKHLTSNSSSSSSEKEREKKKVKKEKKKKNNYDNESDARRFPRGRLGSSMNEQHEQ
jgi:hypothetical protein